MCLGKEGRSLLANYSRTNARQTPNVNLVKTTTNLTPTPNPNTIPKPKPKPYSIKMGINFYVNG